MPLTSGVRLGPYEITEPLGSGGMGDVYGAIDRRLHRRVAIKMVAERHRDRPDLRQRFKIETAAIAALNHPHICQLYDVGEHEGADYVVMELLEGETLAARLARGLIRVDDALRFACEIADALAGAHTRGIIHRDLKPENVFLTRDQRVKILDFGIAKLTAPDPAGPDGASTIILTTEGGVAIGTLGYMAPEQLKGEAADERSDIFALGATLHEMLSGTPAFRRDSRVATVNAVLESDPPELGDDLPPMLRLMVSRCLEKDPRNRFQSAKDLAFALQSTSDTGAAISRAVPHRPPRSLDVRWVGAALVLTALGASAATSLFRDSPAPTPPPVRRFAIVPPMRVNGFDVARNGGALAYSAGPTPNLSHLYVRRLDELSAQLIAGTEGAFLAFFSPDAEWIGFATADALKKVRASGGPTTTLAAVSDVMGALWSDAGEIILARREQGLAAVSAEGGLLIPLTTLDQEHGEIDHHSPSLLPGGRVMLFTTHAGTGPYRIAARSRDTGEQRILIDEGFQAQYVPSGHLVYSHGRSLWAAPFDADRLQLTGPPVPVVEGALTFALAGDGTLAYIPDVSRGGRTLVWVDQQGRSEPLPLPARHYDSPTVSPDGARLAVQISERGESSIWIHELATGALHRFSTGSADTHPVWAHDGRQILYASRHSAVHHIMAQSLDPIAPPRSLISSSTSALVPSALTTDGRLVYDELWPSGRMEIKQLRRGAATPELLVAESVQAAAPTVSPDGRWMAYLSLVKLRPDVMVRPLDGGAPRQITTEGGGHARWSRDGNRITFRHRPTRQFMSVVVDTAPTFRLGRPERLFDDAYVIDAPGVPYDHAADGRFVFIKPSEGDLSPSPIYIVENWFHELRRRAPATR